MTQEQLIKGLQAGEEAAFRYLLATYGDRLLQSAYLLTKDYQLAEDALQETVLTVGEKIGQFRGEASLYTWLHKIMLNKCRQVLRKKRPLLGMDLFAGWEDAGGVQEPPSLENLAVADAVKSLPSRYREVVVLHYFLDLSVQQVAEVAGLRAGTVKSRLARARKILERQLTNVELVGGEKYDQQFEG